jgi:hypothetical protein
LLITVNTLAPIVCHSVRVVALHLKLLYVGEGEYVIPTCTVFGLEKEELNQLKEKGLRQDTIYLTLKIIP